MALTKKRGIYLIKILRAVTLRRFRSSHRCPVSILTHLNSFSCLVFAADHHSLCLGVVRASNIFPILSAILLLMGGVCIAASRFYKSKRNIILGAGILFVAAGKLWILYVRRCVDMCSSVCVSECVKGGLENITCTNSFHALFGKCLVVFRLLCHFNRGFYIKLILPVVFIENITNHHVKQVYLLVL